MVEVSELSHAFEGRTVLDDISLSVEKGKICTIMGSSGGGKTTLLKCIGGLLTPTKGSVTVGGVDVVKSPVEAHRKMGFVFQYAALLDSINVRDNVLFGLRRMKKMSKAEEDEVLLPLLKELGLEGSEELMPSELSGGMRKRVGLARALCMEPEVLLYDEPTSGLDPVTAYSIDRTIVETRDKFGITSIVVSHDVGSMMRTSDQVVFLNQGKALYDGGVDGFFDSEAASIHEMVTKARAGSFAISD